MEFGTPHTNISCCLPCPATDWTYSLSFATTTRVGNVLALCSLIFAAFLMLTSVALPVETTRMDFTSTGLVASQMLLSLALALPLVSAPRLCHDAITPNDFRTDGSCLATGSLLIMGSMGSAVWRWCHSPLSASER